MVGAQRHSLNGKRLRIRVRLMSKLIRGLPIMFPAVRVVHMVKATTDDRGKTPVYSVAQHHKSLSLP